MDEIRFGFNLPHSVRDIPGCAREIEELGYDFFGIPEHLMMGNPPSVGIMSLPALGAAAGATKRVRLLSSVLILPIYHPVMLAKLVITLDNASNGRYIFGIGVGGESEHEYRAVNVPVKERGARANEMLTIIKKLWTEEHVSYQGKYYQVDDITLNPGPVHQPYPAIWVAGRREAAMRRAARFGDGWLPYLYSPERYRQSVATIREFAAGIGRSLDGFEWAFHPTVVLGDSREEALQTAVASFGYQSSRDPSAVVRDYWVYGTPSDVIERLEQYVEAGVREFSIIAPGGEAGSMEAARTLAAKVVPHFRH